MKVNDNRIRVRHSSLEVFTRVTLAGGRVGSWLAGGPIRGGQSKSIHYLFLCIVFILFLFLGSYLRTFLRCA